MRISASFINTLLFIAIATKPAHAAEATGMARLLPPDEQQKIRSERSFTVGVPLVEPYNLPGHFQWRPNGSLLFGAGYDSSLHGASEQTLEAAGEAYSLHANQHSATAYVQYYPLPQSGFYLGLGGESRFGSFTVNKAASGAAKGPLVARGDYQASYAGPAIGLSWIWNNGITFGFDATKRKRMQGKVAKNKFSPEAPADLAGEVAARVTPDTVVGSIMLGYSF